MKTDQCAAASNPALSMGDEFRRSMHEACAGAYRLAPTMQREPCSCECHDVDRDEEGFVPAPESVALPILTAPATDEPGASREDQRKGRKRPPSGKRACEHCGAPTGGRFAPGHDAKLKSELARRALTENDPDAWAELIIRRWDHLTSYSPSQRVRKAGERAAREADGTWLRDRNAARQHRHTGEL